MSSGPNCDICPRKELDDGYCEECQKNWWHMHNIKRCQYAYDVDHGPRYPEMEKKVNARMAIRPRATPHQSASGHQLPLKGKPKKAVPAEFRRQREREKEIQRKMESFEVTPESREANEYGRKLFEEIFGDRLKALG